MVGSSWLSPQENLARGTKVLTYTLHLDACVYHTLFKAPRCAPAGSSCFAFEYPCFCQGACQLSHLLDTITYHTVYGTSIIRYSCYFSLSLKRCSFLHSLTTYPHKLPHCAAVMITTRGRNRLGDAGGSHGWLGLLKPLLTRKKSQVGTYFSSSGHVPLHPWDILCITASS